MALELAHKRIHDGRQLITQVTDLEKMSVDGASKLRKRVQAEVKSLTKKLHNEGKLKEEFIACSNLGQLEALTQVALKISDVTGVLKNFLLGGEEKLVVDVVANKGQRWIKVILRNPKALHLAFVTRGRKCVKPLDEVAEEYLMCADQNQIYYTPPKVVFWFCSGVSEGLAGSLEDLGVGVEGTRIPDEDLGLPDYSMPDSDDSETEEDSWGSNYSDLEISECGEFIRLRERGVEHEVSVKELGTENQQTASVDSIVSNNEMKNKNEATLCNNLKPSENSQTQSESKSLSDLKRVNLDVTAMIAYVSATSNGQANFTFEDKFLSEQAEWERKNPVKAVLDGYFEGRELVACQEAVEHFKEIVSIIGGDGEKQRANDFVARLAVVPGQDIFKDRVKLNGKVRKLARVIFGTSEALKAITVTSNKHFVRSVENQGLRPVVLYHEPRALTEQKQDTAIPL